MFNMSRMWSLAASSSLVLFNLLCLVHGQSCYYPDGSLALDDTPCSSNGITVCCGYGFACLENGVCQVTTLAQSANPDMNKDINYFRGSCTDQTWASPDCPQFCIGTQYANNGGNSMQYCSADTFCCYGGTCDCSTGFNVTTFTKGAVAYTTIGVPGSGTTATSSSSSTSSAADSSTATSSAQITEASTSTDASKTASSAAATETSSSSPTPAPSSSDSGLSAGAKAGIGVGVALGVVLLAVVGFLFWRTQRQHKELQGLISQREPLQPNMQDHHQSMTSGPSELSGQSTTPVWSQNQNPAQGYYHSSNHSASTPSNHPTELHA